MYKIEQFIHGAMLLAVLAGEAVWGSAHPYFCILLVGLLLVVFTMRSLSEKPSWFLHVVQVVVSAVFVVLSGGYFACLIFFECRMSGKMRWQVIFPSVAYAVVIAVSRKESLPLAVAHFLVLTMGSGALCLMERLIVNYISAKAQMERIVKVTAVNEMYEKKLNKELVAKNYLADKNARLEERENISRNIHNSVGHSITATIMALDAADLLFDTEPDRAREKMNTANDRMRTSLESIRRAVRVLDTESKYVSMGDFIQGLIAVTDNFSMDTSLRIRTDFPDGNADVPILHEHAEFLTGAVQELLVNGVRHGGADLFLVMLTVDSRHIRLMLSDNGRSDFSEGNRYRRIQEGFGLKKLISYAEKCGGSAGFANEGGFRTEIVLPIGDASEG